MMLNSLLISSLLLLLSYGGIAASDRYVGSMSTQTCKRLESYVSKNCDCSYYTSNKCNKPNCGDDYGNGEGSSYRHSSNNGNDDRYGGYNGEGGSYRKKNGGRGLADTASTTTIEGGEEDFQEGPEETIINRSRDLCGVTWETRCECCCGKNNKANY